MRHKVRVLILTAALGACGGKDSTAPANPPTIAGTWAFAGSIGNAQLSYSCVLSGSTLTVNQTGSTFTGVLGSGTMVCTAPGGASVDTTSDSNISAGRISNGSVSFADQDGCQYSGTISGTPPDRLSGAVTCLIALSGTSYTFTGTWQASR